MTELPEPDDPEREQKLYEYAITLLKSNYGLKQIRASLMEFGVSGEKADQIIIKAVRRPADLNAVPKRGDRLVAIAENQRKSRDLMRNGRILGFIGWGIELLMGGFKPGNPIVSLIVVPIALVGTVMWITGFWQQLNPPRMDDTYHDDDLSYPL